MNEHSFRMFELANKGFGCSQVLTLMALEAQGKTNPELVRAMSGLLRGMACGEVCGALTGGCCVLGLYAGKGTEDERRDERLNGMLQQLVNWFESEYTELYGGIDCKKIIADDPTLSRERCPQIIAATFDKVKEILENNCYRLSCAPEGLSS